jgi:cytochrome P450 family 142 subfamily A polypeptide 1
MTSLLDPTWWQADPQESYRALTVERDPARFSSEAQYRLEPSPGEATMISQDDPSHLAQRRIINRRFTPQATREHADHYQQMVASLVDQALAAHSVDGSVDVVDAWAAQLPCRVTAELIGFGQQRWREVKSWSERQMRIDRRFVEPELLDDLHASIQEWAAVMQQLLPQRAIAPQNDLFSDWLGAGMDGLTMVQETGLLIAGGAETTRTVIAHGLHVLAQHPDAWEAMATDPAVVVTAVEEMIRWVTPLNNMFRQVMQDTHLAGTQLRAGERIALIYPAANRDPAVFMDPDQFDVYRDPNPHVAFGNGTHFCLGANLARIELRLLFEELTRRITNLRVLSEPDIEPNIFARAVRSFDITFDLRVS